VEPSQIDKYWRRFAEAFAHPLQANGLLGDFVSNSSVTGAYAEAWVRCLAEQMITNLTISTGAITRTSDSNSNSAEDLRSLAQIDLLLWDHTELPAPFRVGNFALVHAQAARGIIEVKRSLKTGIEDVRAQLERQRRRLLPEYRMNILCVVVAHPTPIGGALSSDWVAGQQAGEPVSVVRLLDGESRPDADGIFKLIYFLSHLAKVGCGVNP
jgi:hypothetical protein